MAHPSSVRMGAVSDPEVLLCIPEGDEPDPELSIVVPAMNEELTVGSFVEWCKEGLAKAGIRGEILIVDSSHDRTAEIALARGARVLKTPKRGLGRAYIDSIPFIRGRYVLMGDADCTYDFRDLGSFVEKFREGFEFIMGSRFRGYIEPKSMPLLHQYFGTPVTTWILNLIYTTKFSDIHCGMRGITRDALVRMGLESQSWEYASEMVIKSIQMRLRTSEVPVRFLKDPAGRVSHFKRRGWLEPWRAGWINLRAMFIYGAHFFLFRPGLVLLTLGLLLTLPMTAGPVKIGPVTFSLYWMLLGLALAILGMQCLYLSCLVELLYDYTGDARRKRLRLFSYTPSVVMSFAMILIGVGLEVPLVMKYIEFGLALPLQAGTANHLAVTGLLLITAGFMNFVFTLIIHATAARTATRSE